MTRKSPIVLMFFHHWDDPAHRENSVEAVRSMTDLYERYGVKAHYGFVGAVLQQVAEDSPETIEKIKRMKMPIGYHGGAGHATVGPVGHPKDIRGMDWDQAVRAMWEFETRTLDVETREPIDGTFGGYLAIQSILNVIPLPTDAKGNGDMDSPNEFVLTRMGAGSYDIKAPFDDNAVILSPMHESHLFAASQQGGQIPTYCGMSSGEGAPMMADPKVWLSTLAENLPDDTTYVINAMTHSYLDLDQFAQLIEFIAGRPGDFRISHPDVESVQWAPENSASDFYLNEYGIDSLTELGAMAMPPTPRLKPLSLDELRLSAESVLKTNLFNNHDGDFAEPPKYVDVGKRRISLATAFQGFVRAIKYWEQHQALPNQVEVEPILGPVNYPSYANPVEPKLPDKQFIGYTPPELPKELLPDLEIINGQGLPPSGDYHMWMPTHTLARAQDLIEAATELNVDKQIPGTIFLKMQTEDSRGKPSELKRVVVNPSEFLYAMAQLICRLIKGETPEYIALLNMKISANTRTECVLITPGSAQDSFIWRSPLTPSQLNAAWNQVPVLDQKKIILMSLPPLGDKVKPLGGYLLSDWQLKKEPKF
ncbi:MAG: hypothetical protein H0S82_06795 [Anaerolineaceae bacterium]|nr:hypothetical protein [Anaerolineaceae bacterium]